MKIDRYIVASFLGPFVVVTSGIIGLRVVIEAVESMEDYLGAGDTLFEALRHLAVILMLSLPAMAAPLIPICTLVAAGFTVARLAKDNELTALKASGISAHRAMAGVLVGGAFVSLLSVVNQECLVPRAERFLLPLKLSWTGKEDCYVNVSGCVSAEHTHYVASYNIAQKRLRNVYLYFQEAGEPLPIRAQTGRFLGLQPETGLARWELQHVHLGPAKGGNDDASSRYLARYVWETRLTPDELTFDHLDPSSRTSAMLLDMTRLFPENRRYRVLLYSRMAQPLIGIVLLLIGVPVMLGHPTLHKSRVLAAGICVLVGGLFYGVAFICANLGDHGHLPPAVAAWLPIVMFGALGLYLFDRMST